MPRLALLAFLCFFLALAAPALAAPPDVEYVDWSMTVNDFGDASAKFVVHYDAWQYQRFKKKYGLNPSLLKRDWSKILSAYEITDFKVDQKDLEREIHISMFVKGYVSYQGKGIWQTDFPKDQKIGEKVSNVYTFHKASSLDDGRVLQMAIKVTFPPKASNFSESTNEDGGTVVHYILPTSVSIANATASSPLSLFGLNKWVWIISGITLVCLGLLFALVGLFIPTKKKPAPIAAPATVSV